MVWIHRSHSRLQQHTSFLVSEADTLSSLAGLALDCGTAALFYASSGLRVEAKPAEQRPGHEARQISG